MEITWPLSLSITGVQDVDWRISLGSPGGDKPAPREVQAPKIVSHPGNDGETVVRQVLGTGVCFWKLGLKSGKSSSGGRRGDDESWNYNGGRKED